ncbi:hypothetical protein RB628_38395 [Streptomyces sp. ADMS]|nr:hypothetical protein [Streptomyces sp. ADMS]
METLEEDLPAARSISSFIWLLLILLPRHGQRSPQPGLTRRVLPPERVSRRR